MPIQNLPTSLQSIIQQGFLERAFHDALRAQLGFREIADRVPFAANVGETITKTRTGLLSAVTTPLAAAANTDITSGLTADNFSVEQFQLGIDQYAKMLQLNVVTSRVAIGDIFLQNVEKLGENAARSLDTIAQAALFAAYLGGNTRVTTTLGSAGTTIQVDDVRGFISTLNSQGQPVPVSSTNHVTVTVGGDAYTLTGAVADGVAPAKLPSFLSNLVFSASGNNTSSTPGGYSGTLTFSANVTIADGTAGNSVTSAVAPSIIRPTNSTTGLMASNVTQIAAANDYNSGKLTTDMLLKAKATLRQNNVPPMPDGMYIAYADPQHLTGVYQDQAFQRFLATRNDSREYRRGEVGELLGIRIVETNLNPIQYAVSGQSNFGFTAPIHRTIVCGQGALVEGEFTANGYAEVAGMENDGSVTVVDGIAHIVREPLDALKQVITQSWSYIGGFVTPSDTTANPSVLPTATNSAYKRAVVVESL